MNSVQRTAVRDVEVAVGMGVVARTVVEGAKVAHNLDIPAAGRTAVEGDTEIPEEQGRRTRIMIGYVQSGSTEPHNFVAVNILVPVAEEDNPVAC